MEFVLYDFDKSKKFGFLKVLAKLHIEKLLTKDPHLLDFTWGMYIYKMVLSKTQKSIDEKQVLVYSEVAMENTFPLIIETNSDDIV